MTNQEHQIDLLGRLILDGNLSKEDRDYCIYWRDNIIKNKEATEEHLKQFRLAHPELKLPILICEFEQAWVGKCGQPAIDSLMRCEKHLRNKCGCGKLATHNCEATIGPLVCGRDLCRTCRCHH